MEQNNRKNKKQNSKGFYIAVCCCVIVLGITGYITNQKKSITYEKSIPGPTQEIAKITHTPSPEPKTTTAPQPTETASEPTKEIPLPTVLPTQRAETVTTTINDPDDFDIVEVGEPVEFYEDNVMTSVTINADPDFIMPVIGETAEGFSGDTLIFNNAMDDWRSHNGIDILTESDTEVLASADGTIKDIYTDYLGNIVIISHANGYETLYGCIKSTEGLEIGSSIRQGDVISTVSELPQGENVTKPHLHFELSHEGTPVNPQDIIGR